MGDVLGQSKYQAEVAKLADALGSGPSLGQTRWRFESSLRHFLKIQYKEHRGINKNSETKILELNN